MTQTKDLRLVLKREQDIDQFNTAKAKAERELGYTLRDNEFAVRVLVQAVRQWEPVQDATPRAHD